MMEDNPKEKLEDLTDALITGGVIFLVITVLSYLIEISQNSLYTFFLIIGNILIKTIGEGAAIPLILVFILFIAAIISKIGTLLEDKNEQGLYQSLIYLFWIVDLIILPILGIGYTERVFSAASVVGFGFMMFVAPPIAFGIIKGIGCLIRKLQQ